MRLACPYCGAPIGEGAPSHLTQVRYTPTGVSADFKMINLDQVLGGQPRPSEIRVIQSCPAEGCKAAALQVQPRVPR